MAWEVVAEGLTFADLQQTVSERELTKGTKIRIEGEAGWLTYLFNLAGAEIAFQSVIPEGVDLIDVRGENGMMIVDMEADPIPLAVLLGFVAAHWVSIIISAGVTAFILGAVITSVRVSVEMPEIIKQVVQTTGEVITTTVPAVVREITKTPAAAMSTGIIIIAIIAAILMFGKFKR